jgi:hypothetical protein
MRKPFVFIVAALSSGLLLVLADEARSGLSHSEIGAIQAACQKHGCGTSCQEMASGVLWCYCNCAGKGSRVRPQIPSSPNKQQ